MRFIVIMSVLLMTLGCSSTVESQDILTGNELEFKSILVWELGLPKSVIEKLSPEALERIYMEYAKNTSQLPEGSFNGWFQQTQSAATELSADVKNELRAMVAQELKNIEDAEQTKEDN